MRAEPCVCGGLIVADPRYPMAAVQRHNMSLTHCVWRLGRETPTAKVVIRDVSDCPPRASASPGRFT